MPEDSQILDDFKGAYALSYYSTLHFSFLEKFLPEKLNHWATFTNKYLFFKIRHYIAEKLNLKFIPPELCHHPAIFLLALEPEHCDTLSKMLGALCLSNEIKHVIIQSEKVALIEFLGKDIYIFTLKQGELHRPFLPEVNIEPYSADLIDKIKAAGHFLLEYMWCQQPDILVQYFTLKMDKDIAWNFNHPVDPTLQQHLLALCKRLLSQKGNGPLC